jgi:hypothetical protein
VSVLSHRGAPAEARARAARLGGDVVLALVLLEGLAEKAMARGTPRAAVSALRDAVGLARGDFQVGTLSDPDSTFAHFSKLLARALHATGEMDAAAGVLSEALSASSLPPDKRAELESAYRSMSPGRPVESRQ